jgi:hypothetical protein
MNWLEGLALEDWKIGRLEDWKIGRLDDEPTWFIY